MKYLSTFAASIFGNTLKIGAKSFNNGFKKNKNEIIRV